MAGEIEEPFSISFQADSLHSGSISFGRFESEELTWERRSSFSHNRYLAEVEKCSRPGSVIEKKAYFEAHFKKKGMLLPGSFVGQKGEECQTSEHNVSENQRDREEGDNKNRISNYTLFDEDVMENADHGEFDYVNEECQFDYVNYSRNNTHFDKSPERSEYHGECETEDPGVLSSESLTEAASFNANVLVGGIPEDVKPKEAHQNESGCDESHLNNERKEMDINENLNDNAAKEDKSSRLIYLFPRSETSKSVDKTSAVPWRSPSPKLRAAMDSKSTKPRLKPQVSANQVHKSSCRDAPKTAAMNQRMERESPQRMKLEKRSPQAAIPTRCSPLRTPKKEESESCRSRINIGNRSEKELRLKKVVESQPSRSKRDETRASQSTNRLRQTVSSTKPGLKTSAAVFNFKSDERAERRKEFYLKLEEKMHAKEVEMNKIQARTQEKTQVEIKKFRNTLNFKATPMPSFYHATVPPGSDGHKAASSKTQEAKVHQKSNGPGSRTTSTSKLLSEAGNGLALSASEIKTADLIESSGGTDLPTIGRSETYGTPPTNNNSHPEAVTKNGVSSKKDHDKARDANSQRHRGSENGRMSKDQRVEAKAKTGNRRNSSEMVRKSIKGTGISGNCGMGHLAVGVAS